MKKTVIEVIMTFTTRMELIPQLYDGIVDDEQMIAIEQKRFNGRNWVIKDFLADSYDPEYSFTIKKINPESEVK